MAIKKLFPDGAVITTKYFNVGQDWETPIPAFFIIAPNRKMSSFDELAEEEAAEFIKLLCFVRKGMREILGIKDVYIFQNEDTDSGFHVWMFPRLDWMEKFGRKIESVRPIMDYAIKSMATEEIIKDVKEKVNQMKKYMDNFKA